MSTPLPSRGWLGISLVTFGCLAGASGSTYLLYCDLFQISLGGSGKTMATVEQQNLLVKRRASSSYLWNRTQTGQNIFQRDSVLVGPESSAALRLKNGELLEIGENSLIRLDDLQQLNQNFMRGAFIVRSESGDKRLTIDRDGSLKKEDLQVRLVHPPAQAKVYALPGKEGNVTFRWQPFKQNVNDLSLQVSPELIFPPLKTQSYAIADARVHEKTIPLPPGKYFWRLTNTEAPVTEARTLKVASAEPLRPVWPAAPMVEQWGESAALDFRWVPPANRELLEKSDHLIEVAKDSQFKTVIRSEQVSAASGVFHLTGLDEGEYYWRIRSQYGDLAVAAPAQKIVIKKVALLKVPLDLPENGFASLPPTAQAFRWDFERTDAEFHFEVEKRDDGQWVNAIRENTRRRAFIWKTPKAGQYRWRVVASTKEQPMGESEWRNLNFFEGKPLATLSPTTNQKLQFWNTPLPINMKWEPVEGIPGGDYEIEFSLSAGLKYQVQHARTREDHFDIDGKILGPGTYYWRVKKWDDQNRLVRLSEIQTFQYSSYPLLAHPATARPKSGVTLSVMQLEVDPSLEWDSVPEATGYEISIRNALGKAVTEKIEGTSYPLKGFGAGKYLWSVRAIDRGNRTGEEMPWMEFTLHFGPLPAPKKVISEVK